MKAIEAPKTIEPWRIICAAQSEPDYSEERYMLIYAGDGSDDYYDKGYKKCRDEIDYSNVREEQK